jgi:hypothetical protein
MLDLNTINQPGTHLNIDDDALIGYEVYALIVISDIGYSNEIN